MTNSPLNGFVFSDPLLQRVMMTVIVNPEKISGINVSGALALQRYLASPAAQGRIRAFRSPGVSQQLFWPAGYDNIGSFLVDNSRLPTTADPVVNGVIVNPTTVRANGTFTATLSGANLSTQTYFDVRFRRPGAVSDELALNWQQGASANHNVPATIATGLWRITAIRAHSDANDHLASFVPVSATISVAP